MSIGGTDARLVVSEWRDSNSRPPAPKAGTLTGLRYTPNVADLCCGRLRRLSQS